MWPSSVTATQMKLDYTFGELHSLPVHVGDTLADDRGPSGGWSRHRGAQNSTPATRRQSSQREILHLLCFSQEARWLSHCVPLCCELLFFATVIAFVQLWLWQRRQRSRSWEACVLLWRRLLSVSSSVRLEPARWAKWPSVEKRITKMVSVDHVKYQWGSDGSRNRTTSMILERYATKVQHDAHHSR